jgi:hypothetical protein
VLVALSAGIVTERELDTASGTNWLSLAPGAVVAGLAEELQAGAHIDAVSVDIDDLQAHQVRVVPLLLQTGLLSAVAGQPEVCRWAVIGLPLHSLTRQSNHLNCFMGASKLQSPRYYWSEAQQATQGKKKL